MSQHKHIPPDFPDMWTLHNFLHPSSVLLLWTHQKLEHVFCSLHLVHFFFLQKTQNLEQLIRPSIMRRVHLSGFVIVHVFNHLQNRWPVPLEKNSMFHDARIVQPFATLVLSLKAQSPNIEQRHLLYLEYWLLSQLDCLSSSVIYNFLHFC